MDSKELKLNLKPFQEQCDKEGIKIANILIREAEPDIGSFYLNVCIPSLTAENYQSILDRTFDILMKTTDKQTLKAVFTYCVIDECDEDLKQSCSVSTPELVE